VRNGTLQLPVRLTLLHYNPCGRGRFLSESEFTAGWMQKVTTNQSILVEFQQVIRNMRQVAPQKRWGPTVPPLAVDLPLHLVEP